MTAQDTFSRMQTSQIFNLLTEQALKLAACQPIGWSEVRVAVGKGGPKLRRLSAWHGKSVNSPITVAEAGLGQGWAYPHSSHRVRTPAGVMVQARQYSLSKGLV